MTISRLVNGGNLKAEEVDRLKLAFNRTLRSLHLVDRDDPIAELIAKKVIKIDLTGVRDPTEISRIAVRQSPCPVREQRTSAFIDAPSRGGLALAFRSREEFDNETLVDRMLRHSDVCGLLPQ